jgi:hypothetical protein
LKNTKETTLKTAYNWASLKKPEMLKIKVSALITRRSQVQILFPQPSRNPLGIRPGGFYYIQKI